MTHLKEATRQFKAIPPERFKNKAGRTVAGVALFAAGALAKRWELLADNYATGFMVVGGLTASYEFVKAPLTFGVALAKDLANIVRGKNGNGTPPAPDA